MPEAGLEQPRRWAQPRRLELPWRLEELVVGCVPMRRRTVLKLAQPISERRPAEQEWTWATEISSSPFSPICRPLAPVLSSLALHFAAGRPVRPEPRPVWLVRLEPARFVQVEAQRRWARQRLGPGVPSFFAGNRCSVPRLWRAHFP